MLQLTRCGKNAAAKENMEDTKMKILVTGGAGYIGSHTCVELLNAGYDVVVMDNLYNASEKAIERVEQITGKKVTFYKTDMLELAETKISYKPLPKYPATTRDLSLLCDDSLPSGDIEKSIKNAAGKLLEKVTLFDVYKGKQIAEGKKSISYSISMRSHEGTLTDEQADSVMKKILKALNDIGAELRM